MYIVSIDFRDQDIEEFIVTLDEISFNYGIKGRAEIAE